MTKRAFSRPPPVTTACPVGQPPCVARIERHSSRICGPPARWIAPSTPPPPRREGLAAFTIASVSCLVMSPWSRTSLESPTVSTCMTGPLEGLPLDQRAALLPHELGDVVGAAGGLARRTAPLPASEGVDPRPGAGRGAGAPVDVDDARLDPIEELLDLRLVPAEQTGGETVLGPVREIDRLIERVELPQAGDRQEHLVVH